MNKQYKLLGVLFAIAALIWLGYTPNIPVEHLHQKYSNEESEFVSNEQGLKIHFRDEGAQDKNAIVLLHGNSNSLHAYEPLVKKLKNDYRVISLDFPGHGLSGAHPNNQYGYKQLSQAVTLVVKHLSLERFTLIGHSMGGWVAWRYAVDHPEQLSALILVAASGMPARQDDPKQELGLGFRLLKSPIGPYLSAYTLPRITIQKSTQASVYKKSLVTDELIDRYWELLRHPQNRKALVYRAHVERDLNKSELASTIKAPTLLIWGQQDTFVPPSSAISFAERINNTQTILLPEVGHTPILEAIDQTAQGVRDFLDINL